MVINAVATDTTKWAKNRSIFPDTPEQALNRLTLESLDTSALFQLQAHGEVMAAE